MTQVQAQVQDISHDAEAIVHVDNRTYFIDGALPDETIIFNCGKKRKGNYQGQLVEVVEPSPNRVVAACDYFGVCGGCVLQHYEQQAQIHYKQKRLLENLQRIGKVTPKKVLPPLVVSNSQYRRRARLGVKYVPAKGGVIVGFRERKHSFITPLQTCLVLDKRIDTLLPSLPAMIGQLSCYQKIPQIEVAAADNAVAIVIRHLSPLTEKDIQVLQQYAKQQDIQIFLQAAGLDSIIALAAIPIEPLYYTLDIPEVKEKIKIHFLSSDFIQVNAEANKLLVSEVLKHISPCQHDKVLDLFCGLGNFSLPIATRVDEVIAIDGDNGLITRALDNAQANNIDNVQFHKSDLFKDSVTSFIGEKKITKVLLDPPRSGAWEVVSQMIPKIKPDKIIYVSCNPATLARDAQALVEQGYTLTDAGIIDMFPHTAHVESLAVFVK